MKIAMLGSGFIARFYADSLQAQRAKDTLISVYSRNIDKAKKFAEDYKLSFFSDDMDEVVSRPDVDVVIISLPNNLHEAAVRPAQNLASMCYARSHWAAMPR